MNDVPAASVLVISLGEILREAERELIGESVGHSGLCLQMNLLCKKISLRTYPGNRVYVFLKGLAR
jgi:hypothetical protein